jgi:outer membrane protein OmpA-like peptidoglycan-associated protein
MNTIRSIGLLVAFTSAGGIIGCAPAMPPKDLVSARSTFDEASKGEAQQLNPAGVHAAKEQLDIAEASFANDGDTQGTRDEAYLAIRKAELAKVVARTMRANLAKESVVDAMHADQTKTVAATSAALEQTKSQLATTGVALQNEKISRADAEKRAAQAAADLAKLGAVKQEPRGTVLTLSGSVLFASAKWDLLPAAQLKLNDVATALIKEDPLSKMVLEGHTDSQGGAAFNQDLSQHRASAVRDYLVSRGIAGDRITAQGFGLTRAIADNTSPEGRANNRRVEIVVQPTTATQ